MPTFEETSRPVIFESESSALGYYYWRKGSSILLSTADHCYWATAAHVMKNMGGSAESLRIFPADASRISLPFNEQYTIKTDASDDDDYRDIVVLRIDLSEFDAAGDVPLVTQRLDRGVLPPEQLKYGDELWIVGYPDESNLIDYDAEAIRSTRSVLRAVYTGPSISRHCYSVLVDTSVKLDSYDGLSGSPVFRLDKEKGAVLVGMLLRGTVSSKIAHFVSANVLWNIVRVAEQQSAA